MGIYWRNVASLGITFLALSVFFYASCVNSLRLVKALGATRNTRIYWAGGQPLGGKEALLPLISEFHHFYSKEDLALPGELEPFARKASSLAALDYIVSEKSDVFMPSHGGNMGHAIQVVTHLSSLLSSICYRLY